MSLFTCKAAKMFLFTTLSAAVMTGFAYADGDMAVGLGKTTGSSLNLREQPTTEASILYKMDKGTTLAMLDDDADGDGWYYVSYKGKIGYVSGEYLAEVEGEVKTYAQVNSQGVAVYAEPDDYSSILNTIDDKAYVTVLGLENGWYQVKCKYGTEGYIRSDYVNLTDTNGETAAVSSSSSALGSRAVSLAASKLGCRYVYGAAGPSRFDCSGFTQWIYKQLGVSLPRTASEQWLNGPGVKVRDFYGLQPGDLVYFRNPRYAHGKACSHAAIYVGNRQIIHASSSRTGVIRTNIDSGSYKRYFVGARRIG